MAQAVWSGSIGFGLVSVPVRLHRATRSEDVHFNELRQGTGERIRHKRVGEDSGEEVPFGEIVKGYEVAPGRYVTFTRDELDQLSPRQNHTIEVEAFVDLADVDPLRYDTTYYVGPPPREGVGKPYVLLRDALERSGKVAVGRYVLRTKEHLCLLRPGPGQTLLCTTLWYDDEVKAPETVVDPDDVEAVELTEAERNVADALIDAMTITWDPTAYHDEHRREVLERIDAKARGEELVGSEAPQTDNVVDITAALEASVAAALARRDGGDGTAAAPTAAPDAGSAEVGAGDGVPVDGEVPDDLRSLSREQLYDLAREHDVAGRSSMTKDELISALADAS